MSAFTPGPWLTSHTFGRYFELRTREDYWIGRVRGEETARLIAAAPELLKALRLFVGDNKTHTEGERMDVARAAILKATGGDK